MRVEMFSVPSEQEWEDAFVSAAQEAGATDVAGAKEDAARAFKFYAEKRQWRDDIGGKIKFWPSIAEKSAAQFVKKSKPGYTAPKRVVHVVDCCFRPSHECSCGSMVYRPAKGYVFPRDVVRASMEADGGEEAAVGALLRRRMIAVEVATHADDNFVRSTATDIGRGVMSLPEKAAEYYGRMGTWLEFACGVRAGWCVLGEELVMGLVKWRMSGGDEEPEKRHEGEDVWAFCERVM